MTALVPNKVHYHKRSKALELSFPDGVSAHLSAEFLRVHSPSAEVRGHGRQLPILQHGKQDVAILQIEGAGNYALKIVFDDGHDSGLYSWDYLYHLCKNESSLWELYLQRLQQEGRTRSSNVIQIHQM